MAILLMKADAPASFEFAKETVTQLLTLATAVIGVSVTFAKDVRAGIKTDDRYLLFASWSALLVSLAFGIWTLMALTGTLAGEQVSANAIYDRNIALPSSLQILTFLTGIGILIRHASK